MATTTSVNGQTVVHATSDGTLNTAPDVCKTQVGNLEEKLKVWDAVLDSMRPMFERKK